MAKRARIRIEKKEVSADGSIPTDVTGQPDRRWLSVTKAWAEREDIEEGSREEHEDDMIQSTQSAEFELYKPLDDIDTSMRIVDLTDDDTIYEIREVRVSQHTAPKKLTIQAVRQPVD